MTYCVGLVIVSDMLLRSDLVVFFFVLAALAMRWLRLTTTVSFSLVCVVKGVVALTVFR